MTIINEIQKRILLFTSEFNKRPDYIILGQKEWAKFISFFIHHNNITFYDWNNLCFDEIPVIRASDFESFCEAVGGTEKIKVVETEN